MNQEKKICALIIGACMASILLGVIFGYLFIARPTIHSNRNADTQVLAATVDLMDTVMADTGDSTTAITAADYIPPDFYVGMPTVPAAFGFTEEIPVPRYVVKIVDGYIAVFYAGHGSEELKGITTIPAGSLPEADTEQLLEGIPVYTEEALARILQDYGS